MSGVNRIGREPTLPKNSRGPRKWWPFRRKAIRVLWDAGWPTEAIDTIFRVDSSYMAKRHGWPARRDFGKRAVVRVEAAWRHGRLIRAAQLDAAALASLERDMGS